LGLLLIGIFVKAHGKIHGFTLAEMAIHPHNNRMHKEYEWYTDPRYAPDSKTAPRQCDKPGCSSHGEFKAPRTRGSRDYYWFCMPHVQEYNKQWNYFANMSPAEVEHFQREAITGHRPTWRMGTFAGKGKKSATEQLEEKLFTFLNPDQIPAAKSEMPMRVLKPKYRKALAELGADWPISAEALKKTYKQLAKQHHPDMQHKNREEATERFKAISESYHLLQRAMEAGEI
jgi:DnaJ-domain-containing protein 1